MVTGQVLLETLDFTVSHRTRIEFDTVIFAVGALVINIQKHYCLICKRLFKFIMILINLSNCLDKSSWCKFQMMLQWLDFDAETLRKNQYDLVVQALICWSNILLLNVNFGLFQLEQAISDFHCRGHHILIFGRRHMKRWEAYKRYESNDNVQWFFTANESVLHCICFCCFQFHSCKLY